MKIEAEKNKYHGSTGWESDLELFSDVAVTWKQWIGHSRDHLNISKLLLPHIEKHQKEIKYIMHSGLRGNFHLPYPVIRESIYFMHCAFAIENAFKSIIASMFTQKIKAEIIRTNKIPKILIGHDLVDLGKRAQFSITTDEEYILTFLTRYGVWAGKYPIPIKNDDNSITKKLSNGAHYMTGGYNPEKIADFLAFCEHIHSWAISKIQELSSSIEQ